MNSPIYIPYAKVVPNPIKESKYIKFCCYNHSKPKLVYVLEYYVKVKPDGIYGTCPCCGKMVTDLAQDGFKKRKSL